MSNWKLKSLCVLGALCGGIVARAQPAPDPELERQSFQVADGFEVNLYAADPMLAKPIQMNFDPAGRLWVATSEVYPQIKPGEVADDKILVLEDTTGAGRADKVTAFARGLLIPTAVLPGDGGAYVANSTEILHLRDTDGDGKADASRVVLSGFGTEDTHHLIHTFRWGQDGIFYFNQSIYIHSHVETPWGPRRLLGGGTWAFRPDTMEMSVFTRGLVNHWGHAWSKYGDSFLTDGAGGEGVNYAFPGAAYTTAVGAPRIMKGLNPGSPKYAGAEVVSGRHFPDDWQGDLVTNDFRANRVVRYKLSEDGAGFASKLMPDVIKTKDKAFRPVDVKMGPDGAIYIADWYNPIINHGEVDFRDARRDKTHGRIWRVTAKGRPPVARPKLVGASVEDLLNHLKDPEDYTRRQARLVLRETDKSKVLPTLGTWVASLPADDEFTRLQALWTYQTLNTPNPALLRQLLGAKDAGIRVAATRVLGDRADRLSPSPESANKPVSSSGATLVGEGRGEGSSALELLKTLVTDPHPRVRLEAVRALANFPQPDVMAIALRVLDHPMDQFLDYALYLTANDLQPYWLPAFQSGQLTFDHSAKKIEFALKAIRNPAAIKPLVDAFKAGKISPESRKDIVELIGSLGGPGDLSVLFDAAVSPDADNALRLSILQSLDRAARQRNVRPKADVANLKPFLTAPTDDAVSAAAIRLAGALKATSLRDDIIAAATRADRALQARAGIDALADLGDTDSLKQLRALGSADKTPVRLWAAAALAQHDTKAASTLLASTLERDAGPYEIDLAPVFASFLKKKDGVNALGSALGSAKLQPDAAKLALRAVYALGRSDQPLVQPLQTAAKIDSQPKQLSDSDMKQLVADVQSKGDPARGEAIFRRADTGCFRCHAIAGAGGQLAPDLTSAASAPVDYLIDSILQPGKAVKENYHALIVETKDGDQVTGIKVRQTASELVLRDAVQDEIVIPQDTIKGRPREGGSMMPAGLADPLTRQELLDLVRFLSELGRPGPYAVGAQPVARRWEVLQSPAALAATRDPKARLNLASESWMPDYATVSGALPITSGLARFQVNVTTAGPVKFTLTKPPGGAAAWVDDAPSAAPLGDELIANLSAGVHTVTLAVPAGSALSTTALRVELGEVPGSPAKAQFVTGR